MTGSTRLLFINQFFWPDTAATAQLLADLAEDAVREGFDVTVLTGRRRYAAAAAGSLAAHESWRGVEIHRVASTGFGGRTSWGRVADGLSFIVAAAFWLLRTTPPDVVVCLSSPPLVAVLGWLVGLRGAAFIYKVEDLYPDIAVALGVLRPGSLLVRGLDRCSRALVKAAATCVALDRTMEEALWRTGARSVEVIPNWADGAAIRPDRAAGERFRRDLGLDSRTLVLYAGNLGRAHRFDAICKAAQRLEEAEEPVQFLFVGGGPRWREVVAATRGLENVRLLPYQERELLGALYNAADIHLVSLRGEAAGMLVPSKYAAALAAGKPVLLVGGARFEMASEIEDEGIGWNCPHEEQAIAETLSRAGDQRRLTTMGNAARQLFDRRYSRARASASWMRLLHSTAGRIDSSGRIGGCCRED